MKKTVAERCKMLRKTAEWVRSEFVGQVDETGQSEVDAEADNIEWAATELERFAAEPTEVPKHDLCRCGRCPPESLGPDPDPLF